MLYIAAIAIVAAGVGLTLFRKLGSNCESRAEELVFSIGLGLGALAIAVMWLGLCHLLYPWALFGLLALGALFGSRELIGFAGRMQSHVTGRRPDWRSFHFWLVARVALGFCLNLLRALMPAHGPTDPLAYHLALPKLYLLRHHISFERTLTGALYPDNVGMLYLLAIGLRDASLAQAVHWFMGVTTVVAVCFFSRAYFDARVGVWATAIYAFTPVVVFFAPLSYVDLGVGLFQFLGLWAFYKWLQDGQDRTLVLAAAFVGLGMGAKHTAVFMAIAVGAIVAARGICAGSGFRSTARSLALYSAIALGLALPWYGRAVWEAGNPVWPVANEIFDGLPYGGSFSLLSSEVPGAAEASFIDRAKDLLYWSSASLWEWAWSDHLGWQRATGIYYIALLPGVLIYWRISRVRWLAAAGLAYYLMAVLYVDGNPRYNLALFALLSVLAGFVAERLSRQRVRLLGLFFKAAFAFTLVANLAQTYAMSYQAIQYAASQQTPEGFLLENEANYRAMRFIEKQLPEDAKVLLQGIVKGYYCERGYMWDHPNQMLLQYADYPTSAELLARMRELDITHILRMIHIPPGRTQGVGYPQYFADALHEDFRKKYLKLLHRDSAYVVFEVVYPS